MSDNRDRFERAVELFVYAPIGAGLYLAELAPPIIESVVARGRAEFDRRQEDVQRHVTTVRSTGQVAIAFGLPKLRERVEGMINERFAPKPAETPARRAPVAATPAAPVAPRVMTTPSPVIPPRPATSEPASPDLSVVASATDAPASDELPIPGYDALSASQVVERLAGLGRDELDAVHAYEAAHRHRRTILGKIEQLAG
jgi:hypothetical protein